MTELERWRPWALTELECARCWRDMNVSVISKAVTIINGNALCVRHVRALIQRDRGEIDQ